MVLPFEAWYGDQYAPYDVDRDKSGSRSIDRSLDIVA